MATQLQLHVEPLHLGLATARAGMQLQPGELLQGANCCYIPGSMSLHIAPSRTNYASGLGGAVTGLAYAPFDFILGTYSTTNGSVLLTVADNTTTKGIQVGGPVVGDGIPANTTVVSVSGTNVTISNNATITASSVKLKMQAQHYLLAQCNGQLQASEIVAASFSNLETYSPGIFSAITYINNNVLINGQNRNRVMKSDGTLREHGLNPVTVAASLTVASSGGAWSQPTGFYAYWTTEYDKANDIESTWAGTRPNFVQVTATAGQVTITAPQRINAEATHWRCYRSTQMVSTNATMAATEDVFPNGTLIFEGVLDTDQTFCDGKNISADSARFATAATTEVRGSLSWSTPNNVTATDVSYATLSGASGTGFCTLTAASFNATTAPPSPITGIQIVVRGAKTAGAKLSIRPFTSVYGDVISYIDVPLTGSQTTVTVGSATFSWLPTGVTWTSDMLTNTLFKVQARGYVPTSGDNITIDSISIILQGGGQSAQAGNGQDFPFITITTATPVGLSTEEIARNGPPPLANTGCIYENSLVLNDINNPKLVWYSDIDAIDYFPSAYFLPFDDVVTNLQPLDDFAMVGCLSSVYRVPYFPRANDAEFDRGRAINVVSKDVGVAGSRAATVFTQRFHLDGIPRGVTRMAFFSNTGEPFITDGYNVVPMNQNVKYSELISPTYVSQAVFINNPSRQELLLFYVPLGGTSGNLSKCLRFNYDLAHGTPDGSLKCLGPCDASHASLVLASRRSGLQEIYSGDASNGTVYLENQNAYSNATVQTRKLSLNGIGNEWRWDDTFIDYTLFGNNAASSGNITVSLTMYKTRDGTANTAPRTSGTTATATKAILANPGSDLAPRDEERLVFPLNQSGALMKGTVQFGAGGKLFAIDDIGLYWEDLGREN